jgi:hypothetical protein
MPKPPPKLDRSDPVQNFAFDMRTLRFRAGDPAVTALARVMNCNHSTVSAYLNGHRLPSPKQSRAFVAACGGNWETWQAKLEGLR